MSTILFRIFLGILLFHPYGAIAANNLRYLGSFTGTDPIGEEHNIMRFGAVMNRNGSHYFYSVNAAEWHTARADCQEFLGENATLVYLETREEYEHVEKLIGMTDSTIRSLWMGGKYNTSNDSFEWGNGSEMGDWIPWDHFHPDSRLPVTKVYAYNVGGLRFRTQAQTITTRYLCELNNTNVITSSGNGAEARPCPIVNDLILAVDASGSIDAQQFKIALQFTESLARTWLETARSRVSVIIFSDSTEKLFGLKESENLNETQITNIINSSPHFGAGTNTHLALEEALREFQVNNRTDANPSSFPRNVCLITDGRSTEPSSTLRAAERLLNAGVRTFSIGVGQNINNEELVAVAGNITDHAFTSENFDSLLSLLRPVSIQICDGNQ